MQTKNEKSVLDLIQKLSQEAQKGDFLFRGESKKYPNPCSTSLYRFIFPEGDTELKNLKEDEVINSIKEVEKEIIEQAEQFSDLKEKQLLAEIQHFGGKTNLLDCTTNLLVALYFASRSDTDEDGYVFLIKKRISKTTQSNPCINKTEWLHNPACSSNQIQANYRIKKDSR